MNFVNQLSEEQRSTLIGMINQEILLSRQEIKVLKIMRKKFNRRINFLENVKQSRQTLQNLARIACSGKCFVPLEKIAVGVE